jgi:hypothetical protein
LIIFDNNYQELGQADIDVDIEVGTTDDSTNDFELNSATPFYGWYIPGTELGGIIEYSFDSTEQGYTTYRGYTWRGLIAVSRIICPPSGQDYYYANGEANQVVASIMNGALGGFFEVETADSGCVINNYQMPLYVNALDGIETMLESYGYRLQIQAYKAEDTRQVKVKLSVVQSTVISGTYNNDNRIPMSFTSDQMGINHLLCAGQGELQNRMKVHLYIDNNGNISETPYYTGFNERMAFYDYSSAESRADLVDNGKKRLKELASHKTMEIKPPQGEVLEVGDIIKGIFPDKSELVKPIVAKICKVQGGLIQYEYKVKGEN